MRAVDVCFVLAVYASCTCTSRVPFLGVVAEEERRLRFCGCCDGVVVAVGRPAPKLVLWHIGLSETELPKVKSISARSQRLR